MIGDFLCQPRVLSASAHLTVESDCACAAPYLVFSNPTNVGTADVAPPPQHTESDCACAAPTACAMSTGAAQASAWSRAPDLYLAPLPAGHTLAFNPRRPEVVAALNAPARRLLDGFSQPVVLERASDVLPDGSPTAAIRVAHQLAELGLLAPFSNPQPLASNLQSAICNPPSPLTAWLHLTDACNLACTYCYVAKSAMRMDEATGRAAVEAVFRSALRHGYCTVKLKYAGGEPTLNFGLVRVLHEHAVGLASGHGLKLHEVLLSNGVALTQAMLDFLKSAGIRLMISLDGLGAAHDRQRPLVGGWPSSGLAQAGLERALAHGLTPDVSVTISPASAAGLAETTGYLLDRDLPFNWNFVRDALPPEQDWQERLIAYLLAAVAVIEARLPRRRLIDGLLDRSSFAGAHAYPCAAGRDYVAIGPRGAVASCHVALAEPVGDIAADDLLSLTQQASAQLQNVSIDEKESCRTCSWRYVCAGGCPWLARRMMGRSDSPSPYCAVYRALFPALLRMEGLRILKWQVSAVA